TQYIRRSVSVPDRRLSGTAQHPLGLAQESPDSSTRRVRRTRPRKAVPSIPGRFESPRGRRPYGSTVSLISPCGLGGTPGAPKMGIQEARHTVIKLKLVLIVMKSVPLIVLDDVADIDPTRPQGCRHLVALVLVDAGIMRTLCYQWRRLDLMGVKGRRRGFQPLPVLLGMPDYLIHFLEHRLPVGRYGIKKGQQVGHTDVINGGSIKFGCIGDTCQGGITAVAASINGNTRRVCNALVNQPFNAIRDVILHFQTPLPETAFPELPSVTCGSTEIHLQHRIAAIRQKLCLRVESPAVTCPGATVRIDYAR